MRGRSCAPDKAGGEHQKPWGMSHACAPATVGSGPCASRVAVDRSTSSASGFARYPTVFDALPAGRHSRNGHGRSIRSGPRYSLLPRLLPSRLDGFGSPSAPSLRMVPPSIRNAGSRWSLPRNSVRISATMSRRWRLPCRIAISPGS